MPAKAPEPVIRVPITGSAGPLAPSPLRRAVQITNAPDRPSFAGLRESNATPTGPGLIRRSVEFRMQKPGAPSAAAVIAKLPAAAQQRYQKLLDAKDLVFVFHSVETLAEYCQTGATYLYNMFEKKTRVGADRRPKAPQPGQGRKYESSQSNQLDYMEIEQTPLRDGNARPPAKVVGRERMEKLENDLHRGRQPTSGKKVEKRATTNVFQYELQLTFRATPVQKGEWGPQEVPAKEVNDLEVTARSPMYQSSGVAMTLGDTAAQTRSRAGLNTATINTEARRGVRQAAELGKQFDHFQPTLPWAQELREGALDLSKVEQKDAKGAYTVPNKSLASLCFHSEPQALGATERELPPIIDELVTKMLDRAKKFGGPVMLVFNSLQILGASNPNTVCGNACKPALAKLLDVINERFAEKIRVLQPTCAPKDIFMRDSQYFTAHMSVSAPEEFGGYGKGAVEIKMMARPKHLVVTEFPPGLLMKDNPKLKARKEKSAATRAAKATAPGPDRGRKTKASAPADAPPSKRRRKNST